MARQRVEDLGRIAVMVKDIIFDDCDFGDGRCIWDCLGRPKYAEETFMQLTEEKKGDFIHSLAYKLEWMVGRLYEVLSIAEGTDLLNESNQ